MLPNSSLEAFISTVWSEGIERYRDLPWRNTTNPYEVLVSEVMLQQTQVPRVIKKYERFISIYPTVDALAAADTSDVLELWQGLGYNRRALALKRCCEACALHFDGDLPISPDKLMDLPGIGPSTAGGVIAFAFNQPTIYLETNVRAVFLHHFYPDDDHVADKLLIPHIEQTCPGVEPDLFDVHTNALAAALQANVASKTLAIPEASAANTTITQAPPTFAPTPPTFTPTPQAFAPTPRAWYYALLDYGAHLKATRPNPSRRSAHYTRQSAFEGSKRQKRAALLRFVLDEPGITFNGLVDALNHEELSAGRSPVDEELIRSILDDLIKEGFFLEFDGGFKA